MSTSDEGPTMEQTRDRMIAHLTSMWLGPAGGQDEVLNSDPVYSYLVGTLYPVERRENPTDLGVSADVDAVVPSELGADASTEPPATDELGESDDSFDLTSAFGWAPSTLGMSFLHDGDRLEIRVDAAVYPKLDDDRWHRIPLIDDPVLLNSNSSAGTENVLGGRAKVQWRNRRFGSLTLTTVSLANTAEAEEGHAKSATEDCLFQAGLTASVLNGSLHQYPEPISFDAPLEDDQLRLRYRERRTFGVGHGTAVKWKEGAGAPTAIQSVTIPVRTVPAIKAREAAGDHLRLSWLADPSIPRQTFISGLTSFVDEYGAWIAEREMDARGLKDRRAAASLVHEMMVARTRMISGIELLRTNELVFESFRLANQAMRDQMLRGRKPETLDDEPGWRPFQLAFILLGLASTVDATHQDRELVDLIWFPTGGGKTEAYLGLAAIEMIRRRLVDPLRGGGTAVITRYTMRLLTAQQFQRAARLICALELLREREPSLRGVPPFSVGLWVGRNATPNSFAVAKEQYSYLRGQQTPVNSFQIRQCPWCDAELVPNQRSGSDEDYGFVATAYSFTIRCTDASCRFSKSGLPVQVVDEAMYADPPTMVVATVDKFARLSRVENAGKLLGVRTTSDSPSLIIQDELHLISGPLGTVVGTYEAAISGLLSARGTKPKIVASSATVRAAQEQVRGLFARPRTAIFPPSGLDADDSYFAIPDVSRPGRTYVGIMPQAHNPSWALGRLAIQTGLAPDVLGLVGIQRSAYWTLLVYHNSLRELGRTVTILRDDVATELARLAKDGEAAERTYDVEELNSNVRDADLIEMLDRLRRGPGEAGVVDALAATNILSVGIDVDRLGLMLVNGHPKSTSEYIQATSRVGRGNAPGIVLTMFRSNKPRDRSVYEGFGPFHASYYRFVEPASVTPWSLQARTRALRSAFAMLVRQLDLARNEEARDFNSGSPVADRAAKLILDHIAIADPRELRSAEFEIARASADWDRRASDARRDGRGLSYESKNPDEGLLKDFGESGPGWAAMNSMRSVDAVVRVRAWGEK